jgi:hypothetical protein
MKSFEQECAAGLREMAAKIKAQPRIALPTMLEPDVQPMLVLTEADVEENALATGRVAERFRHG